MEEAILNSLLRYSNQMTPNRETYPLPSKNWSHALRSVPPDVNLSTYYLIDNPTLSSSPSRVQNRMISSASTTTVSPQKRFVNGLSPKKSKDISTNNSRKMTEAESEIKKIVDQEKSERAKLGKNNKPGPPAKILEKKDSLDSRAESIRSDFEEYKKDQEVVVARMQEEIEQLKKMLFQSNEVIKSLSERIL